MNTANSHMAHLGNAAMPLDRLMIFTGNANPRLAQEVAKHLNLSLGRVIAGKFSDGEVMVELLENVRGKDVFVLQSTCAPTNDNLMELCVMVDALKRSSAARVTAAIPYFGYARQDRRPRSARVAISAKGVANMLTSAGGAGGLTMDGGRGDAVKKMAKTDVGGVVSANPTPWGEDAGAGNKRRRFGGARLIPETILRFYTKKSVWSLFTE